MVSSGYVRIAARHHSVHRLRHHCPRRGCWWCICQCGGACSPTCLRNAARSSAVRELPALRSCNDDLMPQQQGMQRVAPGRSKRAVPPSTAVRPADAKGAAAPSNRIFIATGGYVGGLCCGFKQPRACCFHLQSCGRIGSTKDSQKQRKQF